MKVTYASSDGELFHSGNIYNNDGCTRVLGKKGVRLRYRVRNRTYTVHFKQSSLRS